jgi:hypothetical protein
MVRLPRARLLQRDGDDGGVMRDIINVSSEWWLADETARLPEEDQAIQQFRSEILAAEEFEDEKRRARARATVNLWRAFYDLHGRLERAYGQPARDEAGLRSQHVVALLAIAHFLNDVGPDYLAHFANQFAMLAQTLKDLDNGIRAPILNPPKARRSDQTMVWLARAHVALAVETMRWCGHNRKSAAKWAAQRHPELEQLITERGFNLDRGKSLETAIMSWCRAFSRNKVTNPYAAAHYSVGLDRLEAWAPNCDQIEAEADSLLQEAVRLAAEFRRNKSGE